MAQSTVHLPNGQTLTASAVFGGISFKSNDWTTHRSAFPPGWTIVLNQEDGDGIDQEGPPDPEAGEQAGRRRAIHRYKRPSLQNDHMYISTVSNPSSQDFKPPSSPTRQYAMMLWASLWWYFHQPEPDLKLVTKASEKTAEDGRPRGEWVLNINREGIFKGRNLLTKLERMGLIISPDSSVGTALGDAAGSQEQQLFVSRRAFWQVDARIYLFTLMPVANSPFTAASPHSSRPSSPMRDGREAEQHHDNFSRGILTPTQFQSTSHLPTYYPPHPAQYTFTNGIRHPLRPRPFRQGETFYSRYVPSIGQYLSFRVASSSPKPVSRQGPWSLPQPTQIGAALLQHQHHDSSDSMIPKIDRNAAGQGESDVELLHRWMNDPRVSYSWGEQGPQAHQEEFLRHGLKSKHGFPAIGCWDGQPFGYFEIYWVKEDNLGKFLGGEVGDYDRGIHVLVGEPEFRGPHRVQAWLSSLVHYCWLADMRTNAVMLEPRVDNAK